MSDKKAEQLAADERTKSPEAVRATNPSDPGERLQPTDAWGKRWHFRSAIILMLLGALAVTLYLLRSVLAAQYEGIGAALCAVVCGGFLVWHVIHLMAEQDQLEEQEEAKASTPGPNPVELQTNVSTPPVERGEK